MIIIESKRKKPATILKKYPDAIQYMRQFADEYPDFPFVQVPLAQLQNDPILQARLAKFTVTADGQFVQVPLAQITWCSQSV